VWSVLEVNQTIYSGVEAKKRFRYFRLLDLNFDCSTFYMQWGVRETVEERIGLYLK